MIVSDDVIRGYRRKKGWYDMNVDEVGAAHSPLADCRNSSISFCIFAGNKGLNFMPTRDFFSLAA